MSNSPLNLSKSAYTLDIIRSAVLSFKYGACQISDIGDQWSVDLAVMKEPIQKDEFLRRLDEFALRISLEKKFANERDAIIALAFGPK